MVKNNINVLVIDLIFISFVSDYGISGIMPFEVSIIPYLFKHLYCNFCHSR